MPILQLNDTSNARYTIMRGSKNIKDVGRVIAINEHPTLKVYENEKCNIINGTDAVYLPPFQRKDENLWAFSNDACKSLPLRYSHKKTVHSIRTAYKSMDFSDPLVNLQMFYFIEFVNHRRYTVDEPCM